MVRQENFKTLIRSLRIKRHEKLIISKTVLLSQKERAGRKISFDPRTTLILGENDTGKSSLIKAIYATFGADPAVVHPSWKSLGVASLVEFDVDDVPYRLLRSSNIFALFDHNGSKLWSVSGVTSNLAPRLADILSIKLRMQSREGEFVILTAGLFLLAFLCRSGCRLATELELVRRHAPV